jgi:hypothetical protein
MSKKKPKETIEIELPEDTNKETIENEIKTLLRHHDHEDVEKKIISKYVDNLKDKAKFFSGGLLLGSVMSPITVIFMIIILAIITNNIQEGISIGQQLFYKFIFDQKKKS